MAQIKTAFPHLPKSGADQVAHAGLQPDIDHIKVDQHRLGIIICIVIITAEQEKRTHNQQKADGICLDDVAAFQPSSLQPLGRIQVKCQIQDQIQGYNRNQHHAVLEKHQSRRISQYDKLIYP